MTQRSAFWDNASEKYAKSPIKDVAAYQYTLGRTASYLRKTDKVLELGCGTGTTALHLAQFAGHVTATDLSEGMLTIARRKAAAEGVRNVSFAQLDIETNPPTSGSFDVVMGYSLFHLVPDMEKTFGQIYDLLPSGGYFVSKTVCLGQPGQGFKGLAIRLAIPLMRLVGKAPFVRSLSIAELEAAITGAGFDIVESGNHPAGSPPARYVVARKP